MREVQQPAARISLRQLLPEAEFFGADDILATSCTNNSRNCLPGDLFVAVEGTEFDGHRFVRSASLHGAKAVLSERQVPAAGLPICVVPDSREAYGQICQALAGNPSRRLNVIGVTGTNGKTTTSLLLASILEAAGLRVGIMGTLGFSDGVHLARSPLTTPEARVLAGWLSSAESSGCTHAIVEVSSHALSQRRVAGIEFDAACITNVRRDHLDYHGTLVNYRKAKSRLLRQLSGDGFAVLNADDPTSVGFLSELNCPVLTVGMKSAGEIKAQVVERFASEQTFLLTAGADTTTVHTRMTGDHHIYNCMLAAAVGLAYGIDLPTVVRGLQAVTTVPGRMQRIECGQPYGVFVDYAHTPDALSRVLSTLRQVTEGRVICVFGAGGDRDRSKRPLMGSAVERRADLAILTNDNPRSEDPRRIISQLLAGFDNPTRAEVLPDRAEAISYALSVAEPGDCVLIAGKGHENYQIIGQRREPFDDRKVAAGWLRSHGTAAHTLEAR